MPENLKATPRSRIRRLGKRARYDRETVYAILDAMPLGHVAYIVDAMPYVTPTFVWRDGDRVYWHGSSASRFLRRAIGQPVSLAVSILDGLVLARSGFHHSANYRSVVLYGTAVEVTGPAKAEQLERFLDGLFPGRWDTLRPITGQELKATKVLAMPIEEGSAKVRAGMPVDDEPDYDLPIWAGVLPVRMTVGLPEADPRNRPGTAVPEAVSRFSFVKDRKTT